MLRTPEPELMEDMEQVAAYASADFSDADALFIEQIAAHLPADLPARPRVADLGCGPGGQTVKLAQAFPSWQIDAVDGATAMAAAARSRVTAAGLADRVVVHEARLPDAVGEALPPRSYDLVVSSSLLHHLPEARTLWSSGSQLLRTGGVLVVLDLTRPPSEGAARDLVQRVAGDADPILQADFYHSLRAAWRPDEIAQQLRESDLRDASVAQVSERHLLVVARAG